MDGTARGGLVFVRAWAWVTYRRGRGFGRRQAWSAPEAWSACVRVTPIIRYQGSNPMRDEAIVELVEAGLAQPNPTPRLRAALAEVLTGGDRAPQERDGPAARAA